MQRIFSISIVRPLIGGKFGEKKTSSMARIKTKEFKRYQGTDRKKNNQILYHMELFLFSIHENNLIINLSKTHFFLH